MDSMMPVTRSFIEAGALATLLNQEYEFDAPARCKLFSKLLRTQDNDHYLVLTNDKKYVVRVYQAGPHLHRQEADYLYELEWLRFLHDKNLPVSYPLPRRDGRYLGHLHAPEGRRYYALFSFAEGRPMHLKNEEQLYAMGLYMARVHRVSNGFQPAYQRQRMDLEYLVDRPVARLRRIWGDDPTRAEDLDLLVTSAEEAKEEILALIRNPHHTEDSWGPIGGDFHSHNTYFVGDDNPTFFNFDLCGPGWRAYDIATFLLNTNLVHTSEAQSEAFFAGYYSERPLSDNEHMAIAPFMTIRRVWLTATFTRENAMVGHTFIATA